MDSVSLALGLAVSAADATTSLYKLCGNWPEAPQGIHELINDLERANVFFNLVKDGLNSPSDHHSRSLEEGQTAIEKIGCLLKKAEAIIAKIQAFSNLLLLDLDNSTRGNKKRRLTWLENFPATNRLRRALKNNLDYIYTILILDHLIVSKDVNEQLTSRRRLVTNANDIHDIGAAGGSGQLVIETANPPSKQLHDHRAHTEKVLVEVEQIQSGGHLHAKYLETEFSQQKQQMQLTNQTFDTGQIFERAGEAAALDQRTPSVGNLKISFTDAPSLAPHICSVCDYECQCACHGTHVHGSWCIPWFNRFLGSILVSYYGTLLWKTACTNPRCRTSRAKRLHWIRASYTLPPWLSDITLFAFISLRPPAPEMLLRVINRIPTMSSTEAFWNLKNVIEGGRLETLKFLVANRLVSVHDVHHATGQTALHFAIRQESFEMVKILLHAGANPFQGPLSSSAVTSLLSYIHTGSPGIKRISSLFSVTEIMETYEYTNLHKIILGIQPLELSGAIARSQVLVSQVNTPNIAGLTPAHVAATRGGVAHLAVLKASGADLSLRTLEKKTALHFVCTYQRASAARFILDTERAANQATNIGMTPLHCIVSSRTIKNEMWQVADRLLEMGADIDARATCNVTPLMYAANAGSPEAITYLLSRGADINARDDDGDTALVEAILSNSPDCVRVLLQRGADIKTVNKYGRGPLQYLAGAGSESTIDIIQETGAFALAKLNKYGLDKDGLDATAIFNRRPSLSVELQEKFRRLLDSIPDYVGSISDYKEFGEYQSSASISSEDEYFDAE